MRRGGVGYFFGGYDVQADVLFGGCRLAKTTDEVGEVTIAFRRYLRRRNTDQHTSRIRMLEFGSRNA